MNPTAVNPKLVLQVGLVVFAIVCFLLWSYIFANQPTCPQCRTTDNVLFTWKTFKDADQSSHEFNRLGPFGYCYHYQPPVALSQPPSQFSWFCVNCNKHVLRPPNWRSGDIK